MNQVSQKLKRLLFVTSHDRQLGRLGEHIFNTEANKMELNWESTFATLSESHEVESPFAQEIQQAIGENSTSDTQGRPITIEYLNQCDLLVLLETPNAACSDFGKRFANWKGQVEHWNISGSDPVQDVGSRVSKLVITLILKGGKRAPLAPPTPPVTARSATPAQAGTAKVSLDAKGRKGKKVTTVSALALDEAQLEKLATDLKHLCGSGGTVKDGVIEIQGDQRERILSELQKRGYKAKRAGG